jgi:hypothetical protein
VSDNDGAVGVAPSLEVLSWKLCFGAGFLVSLGPGLAAAVATISPWKKMLLLNLPTFIVAYHHPGCLGPYILADALPPCWLLSFSGCFAAGLFYLGGCFATCYLARADALPLRCACSGRMLCRPGCGC